MPKKKVRQKYQANPCNSTDSSDYESQAQLKKCCPHITKAVSVAGLKKSFKASCNFGECQMCLKMSKDVTLKDVEGDELLADDSTWLCLLCGHQGCGRNTSQHSLQHYKTPHSDVHALVVNSASWAVWCYECDDEVSVEASRRLAECIDLVRKQVGLSSKKKASPLPPLKKIEDSGNININIEDDSKPCTSSKDHSKKEGAKNNAKEPLNGVVNIVPKVKGLSNLGNTCFFNAVMQNLIQSRRFVEALHSHCQENVVWRVPAECLTECNFLMEVVLPEYGALTQSLLDFFKVMNSEGKNGISNPNKLFGQVCKKAPQFKGFQQQDSHELLRHLLDGIRTEEIRRQKRGILRAFGLSEKVNTNDVDEELKKKIKAYSRQASHTIVDKVFGGQLVSTVLCEECQQPSQVIEPFMDLSLPVGEEKPTRPGLQRRSLSSDEPSKCRERKGKKDDDAVLSKYQSKKLKKQARKETKKIAKAAKAEYYSSKLNIFADEEQDVQQAAVKCVSGNDLTDADIEDNDETETSSRHSQSQIESGSRPEIGENCSEAQQMESRVNLDGPQTAEIEGTAVAHEELGECTTSNKPEEMDSSSCAIQHENVCVEVLETRALLTSLENKENCSNTDIPGKIYLEHSEVLKSKETKEFALDSEKKIKDLCAETRKLSIRRKSESKDSLLETPEEKVLNGLGEDAVSLVDENSTDSGIGGNGDIKNSQRKDSTRQISLDSTTLDSKYLAKTLTTLAPRYQPSSHECSIMSCLHQFTMLELLTGNNKFGCENCNCARIKAAKSTDGKNKEETIYSNASKQLLILCPPSILTLHLKRFQQVGMSLKKVNKFVDFPLILDLAPFCSSLALGLAHVNEGQQQLLYALYGVVEHSGRLTGGHYTAYVKVKKTATNTIPSYVNEYPIGREEIERLKSEMCRKCTTQDHSINSLESHLNTADEENEYVWYHISDSHVSVVPESTVLRCQAYLLFYERIK